MEIVSIGGGVSSVIFSYLVKKRHPEYKVSIYESSDKILKRVLVSGNGRCNFFNYNFVTNQFLENTFTSYKEYKRLFSEVNASDFLELLKREFNFQYYVDSSNRMYPFANISSSLRNVLIDKLDKIGVKVYVNSPVSKIDSKLKKIFINNKSVNYDKLFIGIGGVSYDRNLQNYYNLLSSLNLTVDEFYPSLTPLIVSKRIPSCLEGTRLKGRLSLKRNRTLIYQEDGELLFKKDGLSGICVFDASLFIPQKSKDSYYISFNPFIHDGIDITYLLYKSLDELEGSLHPNLIKYLSLSKKVKYSSKDILDLLTFLVKDCYKFKDSQISNGGINLSNINDDLTLKNEKDIYLGGEIINLHAICGGFNMGLAFLSGFKVGNTL